MDFEDYDDLLSLASSTEATASQLQMCLNKKEKLEEKSVLPWMGAGLLMGILATVSLMSAK